VHAPEAGGMSAAAPAPVRVAYLVNLYPAVSHTFIRREIHALERLGVAVERIALRGWEGRLADPQDQAEQARTRYVLKDGAGALVGAVLAALLRSPVRFLHALALALRLGRGAFRPWPYHLVFLAEACRTVGWLREAGVSHVHAHFGSNPAEIALLARALGGPRFSFTVHGPTEFDQPEPHKLGQKAAHAAFVVAISSFCRSQLFRWIDHRQWDKVKVVRCGLERAFHEGARTPPPSAPRLVCVGRICEAKGQLMLVHAAARLVRDGVPLELVLAGDGELRSEVEALAQSLGIGQHVRVTGWLSSAQVRAELLAARALVLPSFAEGLPVVIMEAMALGRPVLTTYIAGIPELVRPGESGWLFPAGDIDELSLAMRDCLQAAPERLAELGAAARDRVLSRHDADTEAAKLLSHIRDTAGHTSR
jgi:colanic acid/amylovoran biosynthesis glycosyltransferase